MRYEDASGSISSQDAGVTDARDDADALSAGSRGPATGNTITGEGTITGSAGADIVDHGPGKIVALEGASGSDSAEDGSLHVEGRFGEITMDSRGGYSYTAHAAKPDGGSDVFRYTLADANGERDTATLTIDIGREIEKIDANAQQLVPGPDGVITLPPGVELSDIMVVGRNLVINLPDGTQMVIIDGAVFVPQLVLNGVEVPATNLASLLIDAEPQPAAGTPLSSGGNFGVDVPPLDPGVPLGDLIPPTELVFEPPIFEDIGQFEDDEPEIFVQPDGQPASVAAVDSVNEAGLPSRNGNLPNEPAGSGESADGNSSDNDDSSETTSGDILIDAQDDPAVVTINGTAVTSVGQVIAGAHGNLTITSISDTVIGYTYTLTDNTSGNDTQDDFIVTVTDNDGDQATATLTIDIIDDVPTARPDTDAIAAGQYGPVTGNIITDASAGDAGDSDSGADTVGADNATITSVSSVNVPANSDNSGPFVVNGQYGVVTIQTDGSYSYVRNAGTPGGVTEVFNYTLTDGDGDTSSTTLTITIADATPSTGPNAAVRTDDDAVPGAGGNAGGPEDDVDAENLTGTLAGSGGDGPLTFDLLLTGAPAGFSYVDGPGGSVLVQQVQDGVTVTVLTITINSATGAYTVTQNAPIEHASLDGLTGDNIENNADFTINYTVSDQDNDSAAGTLTINVDDDTPTALVRVQVGGTVDEDGVLEGAADSGDGDGNPGGVEDVPGESTVVNGNVSALFSSGADQPLTYSLLSDTSGLPALTSNGVPVTYSVSGNTLTASAGGNPVFTLVLNAATGAYQFTLLDQLDHPSLDNLPGDDTENPSDSDLTIQLGSIIQATDSDGDSVTADANGLNIVVDDDSPLPFDGCPDDVISVNDPGADPFTGNLNLPPVGADEPGLVTFGVADGDPVLDNEGQPVTSGEDPLFYFINADGVLEARIGDATGDLIFTITLNGDGTFTYDQIGTIGTGGTISFDSFDQADAGNTNYVGLGNDDPSTPVDLLMSAGENTDLDAAIEDTTVNTDSDSIGAQNQSMDSNDSEVLRIDFVSDLATGGAGPTGFSFSGHVPTNSFLQLIPQVQGSQTEVAAFKVWALDSSLTDAGAPDRNPTDGFSDSSTVTITEVTIVDYQTGVTHTEDISGLANGATEVLAFGASVTRNADGSVTFSGIQEGDQYGVSTGANDFNAIAIQATSNSFDLGIFSIGVANEFEPVDLMVPIVLTDSDGDSVACDIDIHIGVPLEAPDITVTVNEAGLPVIGSDAASNSEIASGDLQSQVSGGTGPYEFTLVGSGNGTYGTLVLNSDGTFTYTLDTPFDSQPDANDGTNPELGAESFTFEATDSLGATQTGTVTVNIIDDVPSIDVTAGAEAGVLVQTQDADTIGIATDTASSSADFGGVFARTFVAGADGAAATPVLAYTLGVSSPAVDSGLNQGGANIYLHLIGGKVVGSTSATLGGVNAGNTVFDVSVNSSGVVTLTQYSQIDHPLQAGLNDAPFADQLISMADGLVTLSASSTITDNDGDVANDSASINIGANLQFADDGPTINVTQTSEGNVLLTTQDADTIGAASDTDVSTANFSGVFGVTSSGGADGTASVNTAYNLAVANSVSGLTSHGAAINLYNVGGTIVGSTSATLGGINAGNTIFTVGVSATGVVTLTQQQQIDHAVEGTTTSPFDDQLTALANGRITLTATSTIIDNDGDTATDSEVIDLGGNIRFADDGPDVSVVMTGTLLKIDETDGVTVGTEVDPVGGGNLGTVTVAAATLFTVSNPHTSADAPTAYSYALTLASQGVNSGLLLSTTNAPIFLYNIGGTVFGSTSATQGGVNAGNTVFTASIDAGTGAVTLTQFFAVEHGNTASLDEDSSALAAGALNVTVTATDFDGDTDSASADLGSVIRFEDDGPTIDVTAAADAAVLVQTQDADTIGAATDTASSSANFGGVFGLTSNGGSDGATASPVLAYALGVSAPGVNSGLDQGGADIFLYVIGGKVVGSTSATQGGVNAGNTVFDVAVSSSGVVTLTQYSQIDHPLEAGLNDAPFADQLISLTDSLVTLTASSTITDNDGDTVVDSATIDIGNNLQFADHGPVASNDVDAIAAGFFGTATGNVMTGTEVGVPEDTNASDGVADNVGADTPGRISQVSFTSDLGGAPVVQTITAGGSTIINGDYGVLTLYSNGDYSYDRNEGSAGGVNDVFTYTLRDFDGDTVTANLTINIAVNPPVATTASATVDDDGLVGSPNGVLEAGNGDINANLGETPSANASEAIYNGTLNATGGDGDIDFSLIAPGAGIDVGQETVSITGTSTLLTATITASPDATRIGGTLFTVSLDAESGNYVVTLIDNVLHDVDANENEDGTEVSVAINYQVLDASLNSSASPGVLTIAFNDDTPRATAALLTGSVDEDGVLEGAADSGPGDGIVGGTGDMTLTPPETVTTGSVASLFNAGADTPLTYGLSAITSGLPALTSGGVAVTYAVLGDTLTASAGAGNTVFTFQVLANGNYTFTLVDQLDHATQNATADDNTENELTIQLGSIIQATDADGDTVAAVADADSGLIITVDDDSPTLGVIQPGTANNVAASAHTFGTLHFEIGADETATGAAAVSNITVDLNGATSGGRPIVTQYANGVLTAYQDVGTAGYDVGDTTVVFTLTVNPYAGSSGQYDFDLVTPLDPTITDIPIGGSASFGAGPTGYQILTGGTPVQDLAVVSGYLVDQTAAGGAGGDGDGTFNAATWLSTGVLVSGDIASAGTNGSVAGWGVDNNGFEDTDELFFFDFGAQATSDPDAGGPFVPPVQGPDVVGDPPEVQMPNISFATFEFINYTSGVGNAGDDIAYVVHYVNAAGTPSGFTSGFIPDANIDGALWTTTAPAGLFIADVQFFSGMNPDGSPQDLPPGKIDLVSVGVQSSSIDTDLDFTVTLTDYDGDQVEGSFTINVDNTNTPSTAAQASLVTKVASTDSSDTSSASLINTDSVDSHRTMSAANNNSVLLGAIAAAGLGVSSAAAAHGFALASDHQVLDTLSMHQDVAKGSGLAMDNRQMARDGLGGEQQATERANDNASDSTVQRAIVDKGSLTDAGDDHGQAPTALLQGTEMHGSDAAQSNLTSAAVAMPSAEMLGGGNSNDNAVQGQAQGAAEVGRALLDALAGGGHGPDLDAVIDAVANQGHGRDAAALEALASHAGLDVSAWHMAGFGGFSGGHGAPTMEPMLHHDAVIVVS